MSTLFVGEGDFSFSALYILKTKVYKETVFASCLNSGSLTEQQQKNIKTVEQNGGVVYTDVDATCLECHPEIKKRRFSKIIFNFPHIPGKMNIRNNRQLVELFFMSAEKVLEDTGTICVTLCQGQGGTEIEKVKRKWCDTWQIVSLAAAASLILYEVKCFNAKEYETYRCTGFRGLQKPFNTTGALTHIFKRGKPVEVSIGNEKSHMGSTDVIFQDCEALQKFFHGNLCHPSSKVLSILNDIAQKIFQSCSQETVDDLLTCRNFPALNFDSFLNMGIDYCELCVSKMFALFLSKKSNYVTSICCSICCMKNIDLKDHPIQHVVAYFSNDAESLLTNLPVFLDHLTKIFPLKTGSKKLMTEHGSHFHNKEIISQLIQDIQKPVSGKVSVRVMDLYARYFRYKGDELFFNTDVEFFLLTDEVFNDCGNKRKDDMVLKIGTVLQYYYDLEQCTCILLNLNILACLKYHVMDYRILLSENSFYSSYEVCGSIEEVYRSPSLYPPTYVHDISFYIEEDFCENDFFIVVRNTVGYMVKSVTLIDSYYDKTSQKQSRCYRFLYQSCDQVLSKEKANDFHTFVVRKALQNSLNICLR